MPDSRSKWLLIYAAIGAGAVFFWSGMSLLKLGGVADGDPIYTPLRILNRDVAALAIAVLFVIIYLWIHRK